MKKWIKEKSGTDNLKEVLSFNDSCGLHLHMGLNYSNDIGKALSIQIINDFRKEFFKDLFNLDIKPELKTAIKLHYFRSYSKKTTLKNFKSFSSDRYKELNRVSERQNKGLEWRSFNILNCDNWDDFQKVIMLGYDSLEKLIKKRMNGYTTRKQNIKVKREIQNKNSEWVIDVNNKREILEIDGPKKQEIIIVNLRD